MIRMLNVFRSFNALFYSGAAQITSEAHYYLSMLSEEERSATFAQLENISGKMGWLTQTEVSEFLEAIAHGFEPEKITGYAIDEENQRTICAWAADTFGDSSKDPQALRAKLREELAELERAESASDTLGELADVCIVIAQLAGITGGDLQAAIDKKMAENRRKKWTKQPDGTFHHRGTDVQKRTP